MSTVLFLSTLIQNKQDIDNAWKNHGNREKLNRQIQKQTIEEIQVNVGCSSTGKIDGGMFVIVDEEDGAGGGGEATVVVDYE